MVDHDIFAFCLRRSGHTAIMNWIASQVQPSHSLKDCNMGGNVLTTPVVHVIEDNELKSEIYREKGGLQYAGRKQRFEALKDYKLLLSSFEDSANINFSTERIREITTRYAVTSNAKTVIVVRDPFNLFASRVWRNREAFEIPFNRRAADWYNMQLHQFETQGDFIFIDYYDWATNKHYREHLTRMLEIPFKTDKFHKRQANISSFDGFNGDAVKLGFASRWAEFLYKANESQKKEYLSLLEKIDMDLCNRYFMHIDCRETYKWIKELAS